MGIKLMVETLDHWRDAGLTVGERDDLLVLAENANEDTRLTWGPVHAPYILRRANKSAASWKNSIGKLIKKGVLAHHSGGHRGRIAVYRLASLCPQGSHDGWQGMCRRPKKGHPSDDPMSPGLGHPANDPMPGGLGHSTDDPISEMGHSTDVPTDELGHLTDDPYPSSTTSSSTTSSTTSAAAAAETDSPAGTLFDEPAPAPAVKTPKRRATVSSEPTDPEAFDAFWAAYPRRVDKRKAVKAWNEALADGVSPDRILRGTQAYAVERRGEDPKFTKYPGAWLKAGRYDDEPVGPAGSPSGPPTAPRNMTEEEKRDALQF